MTSSGRTNATSHDVARLANVSQSAVSRAFTAGGSVSEAKRKRIMEAAAELGYQPNRLPGMMLSGRSHIIAVVAGGFYNPFHTMALDAFLKGISARGKQAMVIQVESDRLLDAVVADFAGYRIDGVVSSLSVGSHDIATALAAHRVPVVTLNSEITNDYIKAINCDNRAAGRLAARHLVERGATRFAFIGGPGDHIAHRERGLGFAQELAALDACAPTMVEGDYTYRYGYDWGCTLATDGSRPDAVFCTNDLMAFGVMDAIRKEGGLRCPEDVMIIGFDNTPGGAWRSYDLTSFDQNLDTLVARALSHIVEPEDEIDDSQPMPRLIARASTNRNQPGKEQDV